MTAPDWRRFGFKRHPNKPIAVLLRSPMNRSRLRKALRAWGMPIPPELAKRGSGRPPRFNRTRPPRVSAGDRWKEFTGRHFQAAGKPTHQANGVPIFEERRLAKLVRATNHIAPRLHVANLYGSNRMRDAISVVKMFNSGVNVKILGGDLLRRLATDGYGGGKFKRFGRRAAP